MPQNVGPVSATGTGMPSRAAATAIAAATRGSALSSAAAAACPCQCFRAQSSGVILSCERVGVVYTDTPERDAAHLTRTGPTQTHKESKRIYPWGCKKKSDEGGATIQVAGRKMQRGKTVQQHRAARGEWCPVESWRRKTDAAVCQWTRN